MTGPTSPTSRTDKDCDDWVRLFATRNDLAGTYSLLLGCYGASWGGFVSLDAAIVRRWSPAGLKYIKDRAWVGPTEGP